MRQSNIDLFRIDYLVNTSLMMPAHSGIQLLRVYLSNLGLRLMTSGEIGMKPWELMVRIIGLTWEVISMPGMSDLLMQLGVRMFQPLIRMAKFLMRSGLLSGSYILYRD